MIEEPGLGQKPFSPTTRSTRPLSRVWASTCCMFPKAASTLVPVDWVKAA